MPILDLGTYACAFRQLEPITTCGCGPKAHVKSRRCTHKSFEFYGNLQYSKKHQLSSDASDEWWDYMLYRS